MKKYIAVILFCICFSSLFSQEQDERNLQKESVEHAFVALVFLGTECPISQDYIGVLNKVVEQYAYKGNIRGIIPLKLTRKQIKKFREDYQPRFPIELDKNLSLATQYSITTTPEVILLDRDMRIRYRGAIDNWYYELGQHRQVVTENYMIKAINSLIEGKDVIVKETVPVGCPLPGRK